MWVRYLLSICYIWSSISKCIYWNECQAALLCWLNVPSPVVHSESSARWTGEDQETLRLIRPGTRQAAGQTWAVSLLPPLTQLVKQASSTILCVLVSVCEGVFELVCLFLLCVCVSVCVCVCVYLRFLYELSQIPDFAGRAHCVIFQSVFMDGIASVQRKVETVSRVCQVGALSMGCEAGAHWAAPSVELRGLSGWMFN